MKNFDFSFSFFVCCCLLNQTRSERSSSSQLVYTTWKSISPKHIEIQCLTHWTREEEENAKGLGFVILCALTDRPMNRNRHTSTKQQSGVWEGETEYRCARVSHIRECTVASTQMDQQKRRWRYSIREKRETIIKVNIQQKPSVYTPVQPCERERVKGRRIINTQPSSSFLYLEEEKEDSLRWLVGPFVNWFQ